VPLTVISRSNSQPRTLDALVTAMLAAFSVGLTQVQLLAIAARAITERVNFFMVILDSEYQKSGVENNIINAFVCVKKVTATLIASIRSCNLALLFC
jgi:hypothetical protein